MKEGLVRSIKSFINQNSRDDVEYVVIDGFSSDGSQVVIKQYENYIDKLKIEKDSGIFDAMNKGIDLATGEYIYFLNSGDIFASNDVLKTILDFIKKTKTKHNIISGNVATFRFGKFISIADLYPWLAHQSAFVKTSLMKVYKFDTNFKIYGDLDLWRRLRNDEKFIYHHINKTIASMEIDGIGSNPRYIFKRLKEKKYYAKKHKDYSNLFAAYLIGILGFISFKIFGEQFYYNTFSKTIQNIKKDIRRAC